MRVESFTASSDAVLSGVQNSVWCKGVPFRWRLVRRGFGLGGCGEMWCSEAVEEGPDVRRRG